MSPDEVPVKPRLYFATDVHGSETCWRKFLGSAAFYEVELLVLGGDVTGKALVPIMDDGGGRYQVLLQDQRHEFAGAAELARFREVIRSRGLYPIVVTRDELAELQADEAKLDARFRAEVLHAMEQWVELAEERLPKTGARCFMCPGNDDQFAIDELIGSAEHIELAEGRVIDVGGGYQLLSTGWANVTPWKTHREESEEDLATRISAMVEAATAPPERLIFNFHCPPHGTTLDEAPKVTEDLQIVDGGRVMAHVGSTAVRDAIREHEPALGLHGHIHESRATARLGRTLAINPGSSYEQGVLQGVVVELDGKRALKRHALTTG
jgi:Icc-related predicted phosphoesterase